jgi:hypothetical protein
MNATLLALALSTFQIAAPTSVGTSLTGPPTVTVSADVGMGEVDGRSATSVQPRIELERKQARLVLSVPIWLAMDGKIEPLANWNDPESWVAIIENLTYQTRSGDLELSLGTLRNLTLGRGALVDAYGGRLDPLMPRTGGVLKMRPFDIDTQIFVSSIVATEVVGGSIELAPFSYLGRDPAKRFRLSAVASADLSAPSPGAPAIFGGVSAGAGLVMWRNQRAGFELYGDAVVVGGDRRGVHVGLLTEWSRDAHQSASLAVKTEYVMAEEGYLPGYFDVAYETERLGTSWGDARGKLMERPEAGRYARGSVEMGVGAFRLGMRGDVELDTRMGRLSGFGRYANRHWTMSAMVIERQLTNTKDLLSLEDSKAVVAQGAARIWGDLFASARYFRGWQEDGGGVDTVTAWSVGIGYGMRGVFR